ncbi:expressed protein [Phakopsora pachyrhizi]|uniref:Expressed protein n=1 Tax=Phakopsora pachyrhizi TaxID=170000 RepID=A0AAV0ASU9_PHAPC|nr:expressed protein [Phakopsora pachyrhizi]
MLASIFFYNTIWFSSSPCFILLHRKNAGKVIQMKPYLSRFSFMICSIIFHITLQVYYNDLFSRQKTI